VITKLKFALLLFILIFSSCSCTRINFNVKPKEFEGPRLHKSTIPTETFLKFETHLVSPTESKVVSSCSAFSAKHSRKGTIGVTNFHCVDTNPMVAMELMFSKDTKLIYKVKLPTNETFKVKVLKKDPRTDLASFIIEDIYLTVAQVSKNEPAVSEEIWIIGTPVGWEQFDDHFETVPIIRGLFNGRVKIGRLGNTVGYLYSARIAPGSSGSPVFVKRNNTYQVVGVIHSVVALNSGRLGLFQEFCMGTSLRDLQSFLSNT